MSHQEASTPSSTTGSTAGSPPASHLSATPLTPNSAGFGPLPTPVDSESNLSPISGAQQTSATTGPTKRKPSRRANTAERRATHNAVERQRRETLNGRFLDLAALLPNLATVRRPSKSAIVNSSIASIHASRRTRLLAARELRLLRSESDALRRELNEWRARAVLPRVEEPPRSQEFLSLISPQDIEGAGAMANCAWDAEGLGEMGEEERRAYELVMQEREEDGMEDGDDDFVRMNPAFKGPAPTPAANPTPNSLGLHQQRQQQQQQMSFARGLAFDNGMASHPGLSAGVHTMYEPSGHPHGASHALPVHPDFAAHAAQLSHDKLMGSWGTQQTNLFLNQQAQQQIPQWAHQLASAGAGGPGSPLGGNPFFLQQQQQQQQQMYASPELDDSDSVGSGDGISGAARSAGSGGGGSPGPFEAGVPISRGTYGRKPSLSLSMPGAQWSAQQPQPLATGGGGRHVNAMMMMM
ncbi:hypothetical protein DFH11DRAFT_1724653 [Phellopilus nigrolimitatus]|nr:hypothetical protein DFH11DRAFT_1724653 [Phellopilus nigrolimitatus]